MKKVTLVLNFLVLSFIFLSCEKEVVKPNQSEERVYSNSNENEVYVIDSETGDWITVAEFNRKYPANEKGPERKYDIMTCTFLVNGEWVTGSKCSTSTTNGCASSFFECIARN